jgi:hypothetical protein
MFPIPPVSRSDLISTQPPIQWVSGVKCDTDHYLPLWHLYGSSGTALLFFFLIVPTFCHCKACELYMTLENSDASIIYICLKTEVGSWSVKLIVIFCVDTVYGGISLNNVVHY